MRGLFLHIPYYPNNKQRRLMKRANDFIAHNTPRELKAGVHIITLPLTEPLPIAAVFPREISGSVIEQINAEGNFIDEEIIQYNNGLFLVSETYQTLYPMQIIRLKLTRAITLHWDVKIHFRSHSRLRKERLIHSQGYCKEKAHYLMQLCSLAYEDEKTIKEVLKVRYDFSDFFYFSKASAHKRLIFNNRLNLLYLFFRSRKTVVDLQFMKLIRHDKSQNTHNILLVFKGSDEIEDWATNLSSGGVSFLGKTNNHVHKGFQDAVRLLVKTLKQSTFEINGKSYCLNENLLSLLNEKTKVIFTGHSLGGAIATLAACYFYDKGLKAENIEVYTFGAPPVASKAFVDHFRGKLNIYRVVNQMDIIPRLESINPNLFHLGKQIVLPSNNQEIHSPSDYIDNLLDALGEK